MGIVEIAQPMGPILAVIPVTNPTSTTIFKILIALKTRNPIIISPSRKAMHCTADNVSAKHLLNIQRIARRRENTRFMRFDASRYFDESLDVETLEKEFNRNY